MGIKDLISKKMNQQGNELIEKLNEMIQDMKTLENHMITIQENQVEQDIHNIKVEKFIKRFENENDRD